MLPKGKYYICDPCYVIPNEEWDAILKETKYFGLLTGEKDEEGRDIYNPKEKQGGIFYWKGKALAVFSTDHGDGLYEDESYGYKFPVDAGMLGAIPVELSDRDPEEFERMELGQIYEANYGIEPFIDGSLIGLGPYEIETGWKDYASDWDEDE